MATFVMVHGTWHGGWCWKRVVPFLTMKGHDVHAPTLTGCGEHAHAATAAIDLHTYIEDIRAYLFMNDLQDVILVGHSAAGLVISGAAEKISQRIARLVYLDAFVPADGDSLASLTGQPLEPRDVARVVPPPTAAELGATMSIDSDWLTPRLTPALAGPAFSVLRLSNPQAAALPRSYIYCRAGSGRFQQFADQARAAGWDYHEVDAGHDAMITKPRATADIMLAIAGLSDPRS